MTPRGARGRFPTIVLRARRTDVELGRVLLGLRAERGAARVGRLRRACCPNPRGSIGRGHAFAQAVIGDGGGVDFRDIMAGVDHCIADGIADPDRLGIAGLSYGGYMAGWAVGQTDRFARVGRDVGRRRTTCRST